MKGLFHQTRRVVSVSAKITACLVGAALVCSAGEVSESEESRNTKQDHQYTLRMLWEKKVASPRFRGGGFISFVSSESVAISDGVPARSQSTGTIQADLLLLGVSDGKLFKKFDLTSPEWLSDALNAPQVTLVSNNRFLLLYGTAMTLVDSSDGKILRERKLPYSSHDLYSGRWRVFASPGGAAAVLLFGSYRRELEVHWLSLESLDDVELELVASGLVCSSVTANKLACNDGRSVPNPVLIKRRGGQPTPLCVACLSNSETFLDEDRILLSDPKKAGFSVFDTAGTLLYTKELGSRNEVVEPLGVSVTSSRALLKLRSRWIGDPRQRLRVIDTHTGNVLLENTFVRQPISEKFSDGTVISGEESFQAAISPDGGKLAVRVGDDLTMYAIDEK